MTAIMDPRNWDHWEPDDEAEEIIDSYEAVDDEIDVRRSWNVPGDWADHAACANIGGDLWFPEIGESARWAKKICNSVCEVQEECLRYALENNEQYGIWGGMVYAERHELRRQLGLGVLEVCGEWMPRAQAHCAANKGHAPPHLQAGGVKAEAAARARERSRVA